MSFNRTFCKQTVDTLIRRGFLLCLSWVFTFCLCPTKRTLAVYDLLKILINAFLIYIRLKSYNVINLDYSSYCPATFNFRPGSTYVVVKTEFKSKKLQKNNEVGHREKYNWAATCDFQQCGILTCVDSNEPVKSPFKLRISKRCSVSRLTVIKYSSD